MSDQDWTQEVAVPPKKKGLPGWLMFCGGGCLIAMILAAIGGYFLVGEAKKMLDPEAQWASLQESVDIDARPPELNLMFGWSIGIKFWMFQDTRGYIAVLYDFGEAEASDRESLFSEEFTGGGLPGLNKIENPEVGKLMVQGREIQVVRFQNQGGFKPPGGSSNVNGEGAACFIDITPDGEAGFQMVFLMRDPSKADAMTPIPNEAIQAFLEPFVIGPMREFYVAPAKAGQVPALPEVDESEDLDEGGK